MYLYVQVPFFVQFKLVAFSSYSNHTLMLEVAIEHHSFHDIPLVFCVTTAYVWCKCSMRERVESI